MRRSAVQIHSPASMFSKTHATGQFGAKRPSYTFITLPFWLVVAAEMMQMHHIGLICVNVQ